MQYVIFHIHLNIIKFTPNTTQRNRNNIVACRQNNPQRHICTCTHIKQIHTFQFYTLPRLPDRIMAGSLCTEPAFIVVRKEISNTLYNQFFQCNLTTRPKYGFITSIWNLITNPLFSVFGMKIKKC